MASSTARPRHFKVRPLKARIDARRSRLDKFADVMSAAFGSNAFLWGNVIWFVGWILLNAGVLGVEPFDPYPFSFLTMVVSLEAILLSVFVLISQNRTEKIDELRGEIDLQINLIAEEELTKVLALVVKIARAQGIAVDDDDDEADLAQMLAPTNLEKLEHVVEKQIRQHHCDEDDVEDSDPRSGDPSAGAQV